MPSLSYGLGAFDRDKGQLPELKCVNLFAEAARTSEGQITLQSREGLATAQTDGSGPINGIYAEKGVFSGDLFTVSSATIYRANASLGSIAGTGVPSFAGTATELLIARNSTLRRYNGTALNDPVFPDSAAVRAVCVINFLFVAIRGDGTYPGRIYWSAVNDGNTWDALDYMTAERVPDDALDILALNDNIWVFGQSSVEIMQTTGNADAPLRRIPQVAFGVGIIDTGCAVKADNSVFWIGSDGVVYRATDGNPVAVSEPWLNAKIRAATSWRLLTYRRDGEEFVVVRLNGTTGTSWALPVSTQKEWCEFQTNGGQWIAQCAAMKGNVPHFGHQSTGAVMNLSTWKDLTVAMDRIFVAATQLNDPLMVHNLRLWLNAGQAPTGVTPTLYMSYSTDGGNTYSSEVSIDIGNATDDGSEDYRTLPEFRALGMFDFPGAMFKFRYSAAGDFRVSSVKVNEAGGGRSRTSPLLIDFRRSIFGWNQDANLDSARFGSFCKITDTTGLIAYSPRHSSVNDGELGMRLDVVPYTLDTSAKTLTLGTRINVETPAGFTSGLDAAWAGQLLRLPTGRILLFYMSLNSPDGTYSHPDSRMDIKLRYSDDNGTTWSAAQTICTGETCYVSFGLADFNGAQAGLNIAGGTNHVVRLSSGRIILTGYLLNTPNHYLASLYTDNADGISDWTFGTPLEMQTSDTEPSTVVTSGDTLLSFVRNEGVNQRTIYSSTNGATWVFERAETDLPIRNVASAAFGEGTTILVTGATNASDNRKDYKLFKSTDDGETFPSNTDDLFNPAEGIGYSFLGRVAPGVYGLVYEQTSAQTSFNQKASLGFAIFNDERLSRAPAFPHDSAIYDATVEANAYIAYVQGDGGTIQDETAVRAAITAAIDGNYYSRLAIAVSARFGHKNLGAANQVLYSLNRTKNTSCGTLDNVTLDTTTFAYATAGFPSVSAYLQFDAMVLRKGDSFGCVIIDKAADTSTANGIGLQWTDGATHHFWPAGATINGEDVLTHAPNYTTSNTIAAHFLLDCNARRGVGGRDGTWEYGAGYFPGTVALNETANVKIVPVGGANRRLAELWFFNGPNLTDEMVRQCGEDVGGRY